MPYSGNGTTTKFTGRLGYWMQDIEGYYRLDCRADPAVARMTFPAYLTHFATLCIPHAVELWNKQFFGGKKRVSHIQNMITKRPDGALVLDLFPLLDYIAEESETDERHKWEKTIRVQIAALARQTPEDDVTMLD